MSRRTTIAILCSIIMVIALGLSGLYLWNYLQNRAKEEAFQAYAAVHTYHVGVGEAIALDSRQDMEGSDVGYTALFHWAGCMDATLLSADYFDSLEDAGLDTERALPIELDKDDHVLVCRMQMKNVDATNESGLFNWLVFDLVLGQRLDHTPVPYNGELIYFDGAPEVEGGIDHEIYYRFHISPGETREFTAAYVVRAGYEDVRTFFTIGTTLNQKYNIDIHDGPEEVSGI